MTFRRALRLCFSAVSRRRERRVNTVLFLSPAFSTPQEKRRSSSQEMQSSSTKRSLSFIERRLLLLLLLLLGTSLYTMQQQVLLLHTPQIRRQQQRQRDTAETGRHHVGDRETGQRKFSIWKRFEREYSSMSRAPFYCTHTHL